MFKKVLVPLDGTARGNAALPVAHAFARATGAEILTFHFDPDQPYHAPGPEQDERSVALGDLDRTFAPAGVRVVDMVSAQDIPTAIVDKAIQSEADVIVMATHGRAGIGRAVLGSVAERVLAHSPMPVVLVREDEQPISNINVLLVPVDGSPGGMVALETARMVARAAAAKIVLLQVVSPEIPAMHVAYVEVNPHVYIEELGFQAALSGARDYVESMAASLRQEGIEAEGIALLGSNTRDVIVGTADSIGADLIVMSTHARSGPARLILGSVADAVVRNAHRPVLLVRRPKGWESLAAGSDAVSVGTR